MTSQTAHNKYKWLPYVTEWNPPMKIFCVRHWCHLLCRHIQSTLAAPCVCWIVPIVTFNSIKRTLWMFMFEMHLISGITDGWQGCEPHRPPAKRNVKTGPLPSLYFGIYYSFGFSRLLFFAFFGLFSSDFGFLYNRSIPNLLFFLHYFLGVGQWASFSQVSPWIKPHCIWSKPKVVLQIGAMCRATSSILQ